MTELLEGKVVVVLIADRETGLQLEQIALVLTHDVEADTARLLELRQIGCLVYTNPRVLEVHDMVGYVGLKGLLRYAMSMSGRWFSLPFAEVYEGDNLFLEEIVELGHRDGMCINARLVRDAAALITDTAVANRIGLGKYNVWARIACAPVMTDPTALAAIMGLESLLGNWKWPHDGQPASEYREPKQQFNLLVAALEHLVACGHGQTIRDRKMALQILWAGNDRLPLRTPSPALLARLNEVAAQ